MKKSLIKAIFAIIVLIVIVLLIKAQFNNAPYYYKRINIHTENVKLVKVFTTGMYSTKKTNNVITDNKEHILKIISTLNSIILKKGDKFKLGSSSPDAWILMYNANNEIINRINFYGDLIWYDGELHSIDMSVYNILETLCEEYGTGEWS